MKDLRVALVGWLLAVAGVGLADEKAKIDKAKLVGTWTFVKRSGVNLPKGTVLKVTFTKDGKVTVIATFNDKVSKIGGTYTIKGDQLTTVMPGPDNKEHKETVTVKELTAKKLVTLGKEGDKTVTNEFKK